MFPLNFHPAVQYTQIITEEGDLNLEINFDFLFFYYQAQCWMFII